YGPTRGIGIPLGHLQGLIGSAMVLVAWSASKSFTHYGLRVGALVALHEDAIERKRIESALSYACRGTWSNCNRGGMAAITRLLTDADLRSRVRTERDALVRLLDDRVRAFNAAAGPKSLAYPRYDGGFFVTVFAEDSKRTAEKMKTDGVFVVP